MDISIPYHIAISYLDVHPRSHRLSADSSSSDSWLVLVGQTGLVLHKVQSKYNHRSSYIESFGIVFIVILDQDNFAYPKTLSAMKVV